MPTPVGRRRMRADGRPPTATAPARRCMPNRLADSTSPYLLQHADNRWTGSRGATRPSPRPAERDVPILLSVGYAACHWCHVMAHESFEDEATAAHHERALRRDQGRPRGAAGRRRSLHGGRADADRPGRMADDGFLTPDGRPFYAGTYFPPRPAHGMPAFRQVLDAVVRRLGETARRGGATRAAGSPASWVGERPPAAESAARGGDCRRAAAARAEFEPSTAASAARRSSRRRWCSSSCSATTPGPAIPARWPWSRPRASGWRRRNVRPARWRVRPVQRRPSVGRAALREDAVRQRAAVPGLRPLVAGERLTAGGAGRARDSRIRAARSANAEGGFASALDADTAFDGRSAEGAT